MVGGVCEPMLTWLQERSHYPLVGPYWNTEFGAMFFTYGGLLFDLLTPFFLISGTMLWLIVPLFVFFNLMNSWLFTIGSFPPLMLAALLLFVPPEAPRIWWHSLKSLLVPSQGHHLAETARDGASSIARSSHRHLIIGGLGIYVLIQLLVPLRHFLSSGDVSWTEEGHTFSWHMKLRTKVGKTEFSVVDGSTGQKVLLEPKADLSLHQLMKIPTNPDLIWIYAQHLAQRARSAGASDPIVKVRAQVALNSRAPQDLIEPEVDLSKSSKNILCHSSWICPLTTPQPNARPDLLPVAASLTVALAIACALLRIHASQRSDFVSESEPKQ